MRLKRPRSEADSEANLIPLINIVFLLLIFFMLAGRLAPPESPALDPLRSNSPHSARAAPLVLLIDRTGQISLDGERLDEATLVERVAERRADGPSHLQIKADATLEALRLIDLLARLRAAGAEDIDLLTLARED